MDLKTLILSELKRKKIPVKDACERLGVSKPTFYVKIGAEVPDPEFLTKVKTILNIDPNFREKQVVQPHGELVNIRQNKRKNNALIPFYNADFMAGNAELFYDDGTIYPEYYMDVPEFAGCTAFRAYSDSMEKIIKSGNVLFAVKIEDWKSHLEYGQIYGITCIDGRRYLKYIRKADDEERFFLLKSENPDYDDFKIPKDKIKNIWLIEGWLDKRT